MFTAISISKIINLININRFGLRRVFKDLEKPSVAVIVRILNRPEDLKIELFLIEFSSACLTKLIV